MPYLFSEHQLTENRVFRDAIHGYIHVDDATIWQLINTREMQRLRRIHQLGGTLQVYMCAEHSRFTHSLGVYEIVRRMVSEVSDVATLLSDEEKLTVMAAGLLHDIGHGPFSHSFEHVFNQNHELFSQKIILDEHSEVHQVLEKASPGLSINVASVIAKTHPNAVLVGMISSQCDADRMDYLLRDSYFTGTTYGQFDLERILRCMKVKDHKIVFKYSGIQALENYILARYHMYGQVYYHPVTRAYEQLLITIFARLKEIYPTHPELIAHYPYLKPFFSGDVDVKSYLRIDEQVIMSLFMELEECEDPILSDLCRRFIDRHLFDYMTIEAKASDQLDEKYEEMKQLSLKNGYHPTYYVLKDVTQTPPYVDYGPNEQVQNILILMPTGEVKLISSVSSIVEATVKTNVRRIANYIFYPKELRS